MVYKGYHIGHTLLGKWFIMKDGIHIQWADSMAAAKGVINSLLEGKDRKPTTRCNDCGGAYPCRGVLQGTHTFKA